MNNFDKTRLNLSAFYYEKYLDTNSDFHKQKINSVGMPHLQRKILLFSQMGNNKIKRM